MHLGTEVFCDSLLRASQTVSPLVRLAPAHHLFTAKAKVARHAVVSAAIAAAVGKDAA